MTTSETITQRSGHLAWCALVALQLARHDGKVQSEAQENLFLTRWLADAQKQRRFSRDVAFDIDWLLKQGRQLGIAARLREKLDYLWQSCTGVLTEQSDMFRFTYALETAKSMGWQYHLLSDREWSGKRALRVSSDVNAVCVSRTSLDAAFDDDGGQIRPLMVRLSGSITGFHQLLDRCSWSVIPAGSDDISGLYTFLAKGKDKETPAPDAEKEPEA